MRNAKRLLILLYLLFGWSNCSIELYASPTGTSTDCTSAQAACSLSQAIFVASGYASSPIQVFLLQGAYLHSQLIYVRSFANLTIISQNSASKAILTTTSRTASLFSIEDSKVDFTELEFSSSLSTALIIDNNSTVTIQYCLFQKNTANSTFTSISGATIYTGGAAIRTQSHITISFSEFNENFITNYNLDGGFLNYSTSLVTGGAIYSSTSISIFSSSFNKNGITGSYYQAFGSSVYSESDIVIKDSSFTYNFISGSFQKVNGGSIYCENKLNLSNVTANSNVVNINIMDDPDNHFGFIQLTGGFAYAKEMEVTSSSFYNNSIICEGIIHTVSANGGALYINSNATIDSSSFSSNYETMNLYYGADSTSSSLSGGAVSLETGPVINSSFQNNNLIINGRKEMENSTLRMTGVALNYFNADIRDCNFTGNHMSTNISDIGIDSQYIGGAINAIGAQVNNSFFLGNSALHSGGALSTSQGDIYTSVDSCTFIGNQAKGQNNEQGGGGIYCTMATDKTSQILLDVSNSRFDNNDAIYGGDIYVKNIGYEILNSGDLNVYEINAKYYLPASSASPVPSMKPSPTASNSNGNSKAWIIVVSVISGVFVLCILFAIMIGIVFLAVRAWKKKGSYSVAQEIGDTGLYGLDEGVEL